MKYQICQKRIFSVLVLITVLFLVGCGQQKTVKNDQQITNEPNKVQEQNNVSQDSDKVMTGQGKGNLSPEQMKATIMNKLMPIEQLS